MSKSNLTEREINEILQATRSDINELKRSMPERLFVGYFLPMFKGELPKEVADSRLQEFIAGAGSPSLPVNVVDHAGNFLFEVPAVQSTSHMDQKRGFKNSKSSLTEILAQINGLYAWNHAQGEAMLKSKLVGRVRTMMTPTNPEWVKSNEAWKAIFERYSGTTAKAAEQETAAVAAQSAQADLGDGDGEF